MEWIKNIFVTEKINPKEDHPVDPVEQLVKKTGCLDLHYKVQECVFESKDWRKCQEEVKAFKNCMDKHKKREESNKELRQFLTEKDKDEPD